MTKPLARRTPEPKISGNSRASGRGRLLPSLLGLLAAVAPAHGRAWDVQVMTRRTRTTLELVPGMAPKLLFSEDLETGQDSARGLEVLEDPDRVVIADFGGRRTKLVFRSGSLAEKSTIDLMTREPATGPMAAIPAILTGPAVPSGPGAKPIAKPAPAPAPPRRKERPGHGSGMVGRPALDPRWAAAPDPEVTPEDTSREDPEMASDDQPPPSPESSPGDISGDVPAPASPEVTEVTPPPPPPRRLPVLAMRTPPPAPQPARAFAAGTADPAASPAPASPAAPVSGGEDLFGELFTPPPDPARPITFSGYVDVALQNGEDGPSPHVEETQVQGNNSLETRELVVDMDAGLGDNVRFFGQLRYIRFNTVNVRIAKLEIDRGDGRSWHVGLGPTPFGLFPAFNLSNRNPLFGFPLPYGYRSSLEPDDFPADQAELLARRGSGGGVGLEGPAIYQTYLLHVLPLGDRVRWTFGLQNGASGNKEQNSVNDALGVISRFSYTPDPALSFGLSTSIAPYAERLALDIPAGTNGRDFDQFLLGADAQYAKGALTLRAELLHSRYDVPPTLVVGSSLETVGYIGEIVYRVVPRLDLALRVSGLRFEDVALDGGGTAAWDFDTDRYEAGVRYRAGRKVQVKLSGQLNRTLDTDDPDDNLVALQVVGSF